MKETIPLSDGKDALKVDLYELTMAAAYFQNNVDVTTTFELCCHTMPKNRSFLIACGLKPIVDYILNLRFTKEDIAFLKGLPIFRHINQGFFDYLKNFKFNGNVWAMPEGEIFFAKEPIIQVEAPAIEAQILETYLLSMANIESLIATKASRVVQAASCDGVKRGVIDFGSRRAHGPEAGVLAARAAYMAGCLGTSNVYAGKYFGIPLYGTMAHSWVEAFNSEQEAFEKYSSVFPENSILLVDTYDTLVCVHDIAGLAWKDKIKGVRLDSGNLATLSKEVRRKLTAANLHHVKIIASGNLNEYKIANLVKAKAPIDLFGVGTDMATSRDHPALDLTYKLVQIQKKNRTIQYTSKASPQKKTLPGKKQVFRRYDSHGLIQEDRIGLCIEKPSAGTRPLLKPIIYDGELVGTLPSLEESRRTLAQRLAGLPSSYLDLYKKVSLKPKYTKALTQLIHRENARKER